MKALLGAFACATVALTASCGDSETPGSLTSAGGGGAGSATSSTTTTGGAGGAGGDPDASCTLGRDGPEHIIDIAANDHVAIALSSWGRVYCWGQESYFGCMDVGGYVGLFRPARLEKLACIRDIVEGDERMVLDDDGDLWGWGTEFEGELGDGPGTENQPSEPTRVHLPGPALGARMPGYVGLATVGDQAWVWGRVWPETRHDEPAPWSGPTALLHGEQVCDLSAQGALRCMGSNRDGMVGDGTTEPRLELVDLASDERFDGVWTSGLQMFARTTDGRLFAWGYNSTSGALGIGLEDQAVFAVPTEMPGLEDVVDVIPSAGFSCALKVGGAVRCWGANRAETFPTNGFATPTAVDVPDLSPALAVAFGLNLLCSVKTDHTVWCRGQGSRRGIGQGAPDGGPATRVVFPFEEGFVGE